MTFYWGDAMKEIIWEGRIVTNVICQNDKPVAEVCDDYHNLSRDIERVIRDTLGLRCVVTTNTLTIKNKEASDNGQTGG